MLSLSLASLRFVTLRICHLYILTLEMTLTMVKSVNLSRQPLPKPYELKKMGIKKIYREKVARDLRYEKLNNIHIDSLFIYLRG